MSQYQAIIEGAVFGPFDSMDEAVKLARDAGPDADAYVEDLEDDGRVVWDSQVEGRVR